LKYKVGFREKGKGEREKGKVKGEKLKGLRLTIIEFHFK